MTVHSRSRRSLGLLAVALCAALTLSCAGSREAAAPATGPAPATQPTPMYTSAASTAPGYLAKEERPDSIALVPPPPAPGSVEAAADIATYRALQSLAGTARWELAAADANLRFPHAANTFACALGFDIDEQRAPHLYTLLQRTIVDAGQSTYPAKQKYGRKRPFEDMGDATCIPADEAGLRGNASYPSGHASLGYTWGELLAEIVPQRAAAVRARAAEFGQSRVVCRVHWQSDVDAGRRVGQAVVERLHDSPDFLADLAAARREADVARQRGGSTSRDCASESAALQARVTP